MFNFIGRKKINAVKLGNLFAKTLINLGEKNFLNFTLLVQNIDYFDINPTIDLSQETPFLLIIAFWYRKKKGVDRRSHTPNQLLTWWCCECHHERFLYTRAWWCFWAPPYAVPLYASDAIRASGCSTRHKAAAPRRLSMMQHFHTFYLQNYLQLLL